MDEFCKTLPKIELHAHLNGSYGEKFIKDLFSKKKALNLLPEELDCDLFFKPATNLEICFDKFKLLHLLFSTDQDIYELTLSVIRDFSEDNVKYLELRTTPKCNHGEGQSKESYLRAVMRAIEHSPHVIGGQIEVRLLISIDRGREVKEAWENLEVAKKLRVNSKGQEFIVGIDLSGNPLSENISEFLPVLRKAKEEGFKVTTHIAEIPERCSESDLILSINPDRLGHATNLLPHLFASNQSLQLIIEKRLPIEVCLSSNLVSGTVVSPSQHHVTFWLNLKHPITISTDDKGVFSTSLSKEFMLLGQHYNINKETLYELSYNSIDFIFANEETKEKLRRIWRKESDKK